MAHTDEIVSPENIADALGLIGSMDAKDAIAWLRQTEDTLGANIFRQTNLAVHLLKDEHGLPLTDVQEGVVRRFIAGTAVAVVAALRTAHHRLWIDGVGGPRMAGIDPMLGVRRRVILGQSPPASGSVTSGKRRTQKSTPVASKDNEVATSRFGFVGCVPGQTMTDPPTPVMVLSTTPGDGSVRHDAVSREAGEMLLRALTHALAGMGSDVALSVWSTVCGGNPALDPPTPPSTRKGDGPAGSGGGVKV